MVEIETELRARIEVQRAAIERLECENGRLAEENSRLQSLLEEAVASPWYEEEPSLGLLASAHR